MQNNEMKAGIFPGEAIIVEGGKLSTPASTDSNQKEATTQQKFTFQRNFCYYAVEAKRRPKEWHL
jgi:hypothetical protein